MTEEPEPKENKLTRENVKRIFMPRILDIALKGFCNKLEIDEKNGILYLLAHALHDLEFLNDVRYEMMTKKHGKSAVQREEQEYLDRISNHECGICKKQATKQIKTFIDGIETKRYFCSEHGEKTEA